MDYMHGSARMDELRSKQLRTHLRNVYATLTMTLISASIGGCISMLRGFSVGIALISGIADLCLILWLYSIPHQMETIKKRMGILMAAGFCSGLSVGPLLSIAVAVKPSLIVTAVALTAIVFAGFTAAALFSSPGSYLHLGGVCMTALFYLSIGSLVNIFFRSSVFFTFELYIGLAIFCGFIIYDTQVIVEKQKRGDSDFVVHALDLFIDAMGVFRRILVLLIQREDEGNRRRRRRSQ